MECGFSCYCLGIPPQRGWNEGVFVGVTRRGQEPNVGGMNSLDLSQKDYDALINRNIDTVKNDPKYAHLSDEQKIEIGKKNANNEFWEKYNKPFLENSFERGDNVRLISDKNNPDTNDGFYGRELELSEELAKKYDYTFDENTKTYIKNHPSNKKNDVPKKVIRQDNNFNSPINEKGNLKAYINDDGELVPPNPQGTASIQTQIRGGNSKNSPHISTTDITDNNVRPKAYGNNVIEIDTKKLQEDIDKGIVKDVEIISPKKIQEELQNKIDKAEERYNNNPTDKNMERLDRTKKDLENTKRDNECLIKGCVPKDYIKETTHKEVGIEK